LVSFEDDPSSKRFGSLKSIDDRTFDN